MSIRDALKRIASLEALKTPLARSHDLLRRGAPFTDWPLLELESFCNESPQIQALSDDELEALAGSEV